MGMRGGEAGNLEKRGCNKEGEEKSKAPGAGPAPASERTENQSQNPHPCTTRKDGAPAERIKRQDQKPVPPAQPKHNAWFRLDSVIWACGGPAGVSASTREKNTASFGKLSDSSSVVSGLRGRMRSTRPCRQRCRPPDQVGTGAKTALRSPTRKSARGAFGSSFVCLSRALAISY